MTVGAANTLNTIRRMLFAIAFRVSTFIAGRRPRLPLKSDTLNVSPVLVIMVIVVKLNVGTQTLSRYTRHWRQMTAGQPTMLNPPPNMITLIISELSRGVAVVLLSSYVPDCGESRCNIMIMNRKTGLQIGRGPMRIPRPNMWPFSPFFSVVQVILAASSLAKMASLLSEAPYLRQSDPVVYFLTNRMLLFVASALELGVLFCCLTSVANTFKARVLLWLCSIFLLYRVGLSVVGFHGHCKYLGALTSWLPISDSATNAISLCLLSFMLSGSIVVMVIEHSKKSTPQDGSCPTG